MQMQSGQRPLTESEKRLLERNKQAQHDLRMYLWASQAVKHLAW